MATGHTKAVIAVNSIFPFLAFLAVSLRVYARQIRNLAFKADDYTIVAALLCAIANSMPYIYGATNGGMGQHIEDLSDAEILVFGKVTFWDQFPYIFAVPLIKLSILQLYKRTFPTRGLCIAANVLAGVIFAWTVAFFFGLLFQAWPISFNWNQEQPGMTVDEFSRYIGLASSELVLDVATLVLPLGVIWNLHMSTSRKWFVSGIFTLGGFVCVSGAIRIYYISTTHTSASQDFTYDTYNIFIWTAIQPCVGTICACLPTLGPLFQGGHSPESLIGSIKSQMQRRNLDGNSKSSFWTSRARNVTKQSSDSSVRSFHKMPEDAIILTTVQGRQPNDVESQSIEDNDIHVQTELSTFDKGRYC